MAITPVSDPILHDIFKALLDHCANDVFEVCRTIPTLKNSTLLKNGYWVFDNPDQEYLTSTKFRSLAKIDAIWFFRHGEDMRHKYRVIHEVKTGKYDIDEIFHKYYSGMETQIWVWAWRYQNERVMPADPKCAAKIKQGLVRKIDLEYMVPLVCPYLKEFYQAFDGDVWCARL